MLQLGTGLKTKRSGSHNIREKIQWSFELCVSGLRLFYSICLNLCTLIVIFCHIIYCSPLPHFAFSLIYYPYFQHCVLLCIKILSPRPLPNTFCLWVSCYLESRVRWFGSENVLQTREVKNILLNFCSSRLLIFKKFRSWQNMLYWQGLRLQSSSTQARLHMAAEQILGEGLSAPISSES